MKGAKSDADAIEEPIVESGFLEAILLHGFGRRSGCVLFPEPAVTEDLLNHIGLGFLDKRHDSHSSPALRTFQGVTFVNRLD